MLEIKFSGRGGQGVVTASQMLGLAFFKAGMYPQCYSVFGGERRGAPVVGFLRVDGEQILLKCEIRRPGQIVYLDPGLIDPGEVEAFLAPGGGLLVSTERDATDFGHLGGFRVGLVDAVGIAVRAGLGRITNTAILGAYSRFAGAPALEHVLEAIAESVPAKQEANLAAAREAYERVTVHGPRD